MTTFLSYPGARALRPLLASLWLALLPLLALAGTPVLTLQATVAAGAGVDATAFVDQVEIVNAITGAVVTNAVPNAGFETPAQAVGGFAYNPNGAGVSWTFTANAGVARPGGGFEPPSPSPEGNQVAFLQTNGGVGSLSQTLPSLAAGTYQLRLQLAQRGSNSTPQSVRVLVDGNVIGLFTPASSAAYTSYLSTAFVVDAVLQLEALGSASRGTASDVTAFVDQVELLNVSAGTSPTVTNAGFETTGSLGTGSSAYTPTGTGWSFAGNSGLATNGSPFNNPTAPGPTHVAFLQSKSSGSGSFSQTLMALPVGSYRVRLYGAQRTATAPADQVVRVLLNGLEVGRFQPTAGFVQYTLPSASTSLTLTALRPFIGVPGSVVTLTGIRLTGATTITFTGAAGTKTVTSGFTVNAAGTEITGVVVPTGAQSGLVTVTTPIGTSTVMSGMFFSRATTLATGGSHTVAVRPDGSLWTWGLNSSGQLGQGTTTNLSTPTRVGTGTSWVSAAAGYDHTVAVQADGSLWAWGNNSNGQLGQGNTSSGYTSPTRVGTGTSWVSAAAGGSHTLALQADGSLWAWGRNNEGQLGQGTTTNLSTPTRVGTSTSWVSAAAGDSHTLAVQADGSLWSWGNNDSGQLGQGTTGAGNPGTTNLNTPTRVGTSTSWVSAAAGYTHTAAVQVDGSLWAWGSGFTGQLGDGTGTGRRIPTRVGSSTSWMSAAAGGFHTVGVQADGSLWAWGNNDSGQLGQGNTSLLLSPTQVGTSTSWVSATTGFGYTAGEQSCHDVWAWGSNSSGQVGDGSTTNRPSPVLVISPAVSVFSFAPASAVPGTTVAVTGAGLLGLTAFTVNGADALPSVRNNSPLGFSFVVPAGTAPGAATLTLSSACGAASSPAFTVLPGPVLTALSPFIGVPGSVLTLTGSRLAGATTITFTGAAGTKTVTSGFTVNAAGTSITGVVVPAGAQSGPVTVTTGLGPSPVVSSVFFSRATTLATGYYHTVAVRPDGSLWTWGSNQYGQLGRGTTTTQNVPTRVGTGNSWVSAASGEFHTVAVQADGTLWAWGYNSNGQLGQGTTTDRSSPTRVGTGTSWVSVAAGSSHTVAVQADGSLWTWGDNYRGQLGQGTTTTLNVPTRVGTGTSWISAAAGYSHTVAVQADGSLWAWGGNFSGQLGQGTTGGQLTSPTRVGTSTSWVSAAGGFHTVAVQADGSLWTWGYNSNGQLGQGNTTDLSTPTRVGTSTSWMSAAAGSAHTAAVQADGSLWAWGLNMDGQLGQGTTGGQLTSPTQVGTSTSWVSAAAGSAHTAGEQSCHDVWAWGSNGNGQVGQGSTPQRPSPVLVISPAVSLFSFAPASAVPGTTVAVTGAGLLGLTTFTVNGADALPSVRNNSPLGFSFVVPAGTAPGAATLTLSSGCGTASSTAFTVLPGPVLTALSPFIGLPGSVLTLTGTNLTGTTSISFTGAAGVKTVTSGFTVNAAGTSITGVVVPAGAQSGPVTVTNANGPSLVVSGVFFSRATTLATGELHTVAVRPDGSLWAWGANSNGQLGQGNTTTMSYATPTRVGTSTNWVSVAAGDRYTVAVQADGTLWAWGRNSEGQLGQSNSGSGYTSPTRVGTGTSWVSVAAGGFHTVALQADGSLWTWGRNSEGQLGQGTINSSNTRLTRVGTGTNWVSVAAGGAHTVAVQADGSLWAWGSNSSGQLGQGTTTTLSTPTQVGTSTSWVSADGGQSHTVAMQADGTLWTWGQNSSGQLGQGTTTTLYIPTQAGTDTSWMSAAAGSAHTAALQADGSLWAWGSNQYGQLGQGNTSTNLSTPTRVGTSTSWVSAAAGTSHTAGEQGCRAVWAWGRNNTGQLGDGSTTNRLSPVLAIGPVSLLSFAPASAGVGEVVAVTGSGLLGLTSLTVNGTDALASVTGTTATGFSFVVPAGTASGTATIAVAAGCGSTSSTAFTVAGPALTALSPFIGLPGSVLTLTGSRLMGATSISFTGAAGVKTVTTGFTVNATGTEITGVVVPAGARSGPVTVTTATGPSAVVSGVFFSRATTLATGDHYTVAVRADGSLWAWGSNADGQLGQGTTTDLSTPTQVGTSTSWVSAAAGGFHTVAVQADGSLWAWGYNGYGQLGQGTSDYNLHATPTRVGTGTSWVSVAASISHTVAVQADGSLWAWGANSSGQLGQGDNIDRDTPTRVGTGTSWVSVAAGDLYTAGVQADGSLWSWGNNNFGQLGHGDNNDRGTPTRVGTETNWVSAAAGGYHTAAVRADGSLWTWGSNQYGQLGQGTTTDLSSPTQVGTGTSWGSVTAGDSHTAAVQADGSLWAWGLNMDGQLGLGTTTNQSSPTRVGTGTSWISAAAGYAHAAGEQDCQAVWAWGYNGNGQVGDGTAIRRLSPVLVINPVSLLSFAPASAGVGATVAVTGTGLLGLTALTVNGAIVPLSDISNNTATGFSFVVPAGATATGTTTVAAGCGAAGSPAFTMSPGPTLTALSVPAELPGLPVILTGTGFTSASTVTIGGVSASVTYTSPTALTAVVPAGASPGSSAVVVTTASASSTASPAFAVLQVYDAVTTTCPATTPYVATGDGAWHYLLAANGQVVAALLDTRAALGSVSVHFQVTGPAGAVRQDGRGRKYLDRNFQLTATGGSFAGATVNLRLYGLRSELDRLLAADAASSASLQATQYSGANEDCELGNNDFAGGDFRTLAAPATTPGAGVAWFVSTLAVTDHFSEFYLTSSNAPLPVELLAFTAEKQGPAVQLDWRTASELNADRFEIERSRDGRRFEPIGAVAAQGSKATPTSYTFLDSQYPGETNLLYYRLRQVDLDGAASYSPVRAVTVGGKGELTVYPNPARTSVAVSGLTGGAPVEVFDALGRTVARATADTSGTARLALPSGLAAGVYVVRSGAQVQRLTVE